MNHPNADQRRTAQRASAAVAAVVAGVALAAAIGLQSSQATTPAQNITGGSTLTTGQELESANGLYTLQLASSGNLEESFTHGPVIWQTSNGSPGDQAVLQPDGNLILDTTAGETLWSSNSSTADCPSLDLQQDGNIVIYGPTKSSWAKGMVHTLTAPTTLTGGQDVYAANGEYYLAMQTDGNLVLYNDASKALWSSGTDGNPGATVTLQTDGNLVVYSSAGKALWSSKTDGNAGDSLDMQTDGNLVIYSSAGKALWDTATHDAANNGASVDPRGPLGSSTPCPASAPTTTTTPTPPTTVTQTVTTQTVETVPEPAPKPRQLRVAVRLKWSWSGEVTHLNWIRVGRLPHGARFSAVYQAASGRHRRHARTASTAKQLKALIMTLTRTRYVRGDRLELSIARSGYVTERATFTIRQDRLPKLAQ